MEIFGSRLKQLRTDKNIKQTDLGEVIGASQRQISSWETGENEPSMTILVQLAAYFDTTTDYLLGFTDNPNPDRSIPYYPSPVQWEILDMLNNRDDDFHRRLINVIKNIR